MKHISLAIAMFACVNMLIAQQSFEHELEELGFSIEKIDRLAVPLP